MLNDKIPLHEEEYFEKLAIKIFSDIENLTNVSVNVSKGKVKRPSKNPNIARGCGAVMSNRRKVTKFR